MHAKREVRHTASTRHATTMSLGYLGESCYSSVRGSSAHQMMIHVMRSIALVFRWSCIALSCGEALMRRRSHKCTAYIDAYQILRDGDLLIHDLHARPDLHVLAYGVVQRLQARLVPEQLGHVENVAHEVHVPAQREQAARELQRVRAREGEHARQRELLWDRARGRGGEDAVCERLVVREKS